MVRQITESLICGLIGGAIMLLVIVNSPVYDSYTGSAASASIDG